MPASAATRSISPIASCRCCPRRCRTAGAACARARTAAACSWNCASMARAASTAHRFGRGLMRSAARLTYEQAQAASEGAADPAVPEACSGRSTVRSAPCWRRARGAARSTSIFPSAASCSTISGQVLAVAPRPRLDSHRLIEEFMVLANVAAAEELGAPASALHVPRPRPALGGEARRRCAISCTASASRCRRARDPPARPRPRAARGRRHRDRAAGQRGGAAQPVAGGLQPGQYRPFRPRPARAMRISPARSAATPTCWCIAR